MLWLVLGVLALLAGLMAGTLRFRLAIVLAAGATVLVPAILQAVTADDDALRHGSMTRRVDDLGAHTRSGSPLGAVALVSVGFINLAVQGYAFLYALRRFAIGTDGTWGGLFVSPEWVPAAGIVAPIVLVAGGALCVACGLWLVSAPALSTPPARTTAAATV